MSSLAFILLLAYRSTFYHVAPILVLSKLSCNSLLVLLNNRITFRPPSRKHVPISTFEFNLDATYADTSTVNNRRSATGSLETRTSLPRTASSNSIDHSAIVEVERVSGSLLAKLVDATLTFSLSLSFRMMLTDHPEKNRSCLIDWYPSWYPFWKDFIHTLRVCEYHYFVSLIKEMFSRQEHLFGPWIEASADHWKAWRVGLACIGELYIDMCVADASASCAKVIRWYRV